MNGTDETMTSDAGGSGPPATELRPLLASSPTSDTDSPAPDSSPTPLRAAHLLYEALVAEDLAGFSALLSHCAAQPAAVNHIHGDGFTCLQYACDRRLPEFVDLLLVASADPAVASPASGRTALHWAAARDSGILGKLLAHAPELDVNVPDDAGLTPLQYAVQSGSAEAMLALLRAGANVSVHTDSDKPLLHSVPADVLEEFLDSCVTSNGCYVTDRDCGLQFDYTLMWPRQRAGETRFETAVLYYLSTSREHRHLLGHPLVASFVDLKWWQVRPFFVADLLYYTLFLSLLTALVVLRAESGESVPLRRRDILGCYCATIVVVIPLIVVKIAQVVATPTRYVLSDKNGLLKVPLLIMTVVDLAMDLSRSAQLQLSAVMMMFAWVELFALISRIPIFSTYARMLHTVFWRFLSFLLWYMVLILGLTVSTYIMFKECGGQRHPAVSLLRPLVMTIDKVDLKALPIDGQSTFAQLVFIAFFFIMTVTLTNLVNGLAVTDIAVMRKQAKIFSLVNRVRLLAYTESMMLDEPCEFLGHMRCPSCCCVSRRRRRRRSAPVRCLAAFGCLRDARAWLARSIRLSLVLPDHQLRLYPNRARPQTLCSLGYKFPAEPELSRYWRFSTKLVAAARRLALQPAPRAGLTQRLSQLECRLSAQPDHGP